MNENIFSNRSGFLKELISRTERSITQAPEGNLRVVKRQGKTYYYHRKNATDTNGQYIKKTNLQLAEALAQKKYDQQILQLAKNELVFVNNYLENINITPEQYYETIDPVLQEIITPIVLTDDQYIQNWLSIPYQPKGFEEGSPEHYTYRGERVRSKSEVMIANALDHYGIPYRYEFPIFLSGNKMLYPDFTALNVRKRVLYIWEHMGKMDDPDYSKTALNRIDLYEQNGYFPGLQLILTHETLESPLQLPTIERMIKTFLL